MLKLLVDLFEDVLFVTPKKDVVGSYVGLRGDIAHVLLLLPTILDIVGVLLALQIQVL